MANEIVLITTTSASIDRDGEDLAHGVSSLMVTGTELETATPPESVGRDHVRNQQKLYSLFENTGDDAEGNETFDAARIARVELEKVCAEVEAIVQSSKESRLRRWKTKLDKSVGDRLQSTLTTKDGEIPNVQEIVSEVEGTWKTSHGKAYKNFQRICAGLHAHQKAFAIFPSNTTYTSVLSGSLSLLVQASVNHSSIAEMLSQSVADISDKVASCAIYLEVTPTQSMKRRLAEIYSQLFRFYRDILKWYMSSSASKLLGSFNATIKSRFEESVQAIENQIAQMVREGDIAALAVMRVVQQDQCELKAQYADMKSLLESINKHQRQMNHSVDVNIGLKVSESLESVYRAMTSSVRKTIARQNTSSATITDLENESVLSQLSYDSISLRDGEAARLALYLQDLPVGDDGSSMLARGLYSPNHNPIPHVLRSVLSDSETSRTLWFSGAYTGSSVCGAQTIALAFVAAAWKAGAPILSHFCAVPKNSATREKIHNEQQAMMGLVYNLSRQLLQFPRPEGTQIHLSDARAKDLECRLQSVDDALDMFRELLTVTPNIRFCLIYGMNSLEWGPGARSLNLFLDVFFEHQNEAAQPLHVLLITSGQSRLLGRRIAPRDRHMLHDIPDSESQCLTDNP